MKRILIIDDEPDVGELLKLFCISLGYEADAYRSAAEGLAAAQEAKYWAAFCDYLMPQLSGEAIYRALKEGKSDFLERFVLITGVLLDDRLERFKRSEGVRVVQKPFTFEEIRAIVREFEGL